MSRVCFLTKYPPVQGGVSMRCYWLARGLAEKGHQVYVVTNADEVESAYRMWLDSDDAAWYEPRFSNGGYVRVIKTSPPTAKMKHIPQSNPFVTKLASLATECIEEHGCEGIFSYYLEPYGVAAHLASMWTGVPYMVRHAGSDFGRLFKHRSLNRTYQEVFRGAAVVVSGLDSSIFAGFRVDPTRIWTTRHFDIPDIFSVGAPSLDINLLLKKHLERPGDPAVRYVSSPGPMNPSLPTIGTYGKLGEVKGTFDLVHALARLKQRGAVFNLVVMGQGDSFPTFIELTAEVGLRDCTWTIPFQPHWRVPSFIRSCTGVAFLERDFPVSFHGPTIPREVLACGVCLLLSGEVAEKQGLLGQYLRNGENFLLVDDPRSSGELAGQLEKVITNPDAALAVGRAGRAAFDRAVRDIGGPSTIDQFEQRLLEMIGRTEVRVHPVRRPVIERRKSLEQQLPASSVVLKDSWGSLLEQFFAASAETDEFTDAVHLCDFLLGTGRFTTGLESEILRYERARNFLRIPAMRDVARRQAVDWEASGPSTSDLSTPERKLAIRPHLSESVHVEEFELDIVIARNALLRGEVPVPQRCRTIIAFIPQNNLADEEWRIDDATRLLISLCDGERTIGEIIEIMKGRSEFADATMQISRLVYRALRKLMVKGIITFLRAKPEELAPATSV